MIPKTMSSPVDPGAPSFLTIPGEIRNTIYEVLFKRAEPVLLHNAESYHTIEPDKKYYDTEAYYIEAMDRFYQKYEQEIGNDQEFRHDFHDGVSVLLSCRQLYHEAAGVLYGHNTFVFSRALERHDDDQDDEEEKEYFQATYAPRWLSGLGSQFSLLKKVIIDVDTMCPMNCSFRIWKIDFLPLMRLIWAFPEQSCAVAFGRSGRTLTIHASSELESDTESENEAPSVDLADMLNNVFTSLAVEDALDLKRYGSSRHLLASVSVYRSGVFGMVEYKNTNGRPSTCLSFKISDNWKTLKPMNKEEPRLTNLPKAII